MEEEKAKNQKKDFFRLVVNPYVEATNTDWMTRDYYKQFLTSKPWSERVGYYGLKPAELAKLKAR